MFATIMEGLGQWFLFMFLGVALLSLSFRRFDRDGQVKDAAKGVIIRGLGSLFTKK